VDYAIIGVEGSGYMRKIWMLALGLAVALVAYGAVEAVSSIHGVVTKVDAKTKTIVVKSADGTETAVKVASKATVEGTKEGSEVVVHYTVKGTEKSAVEVETVGKDGLKATQGTITKIDRTTKTLTIKTADGTEKTFEMTGHAASSSGKAIAAGSEKSAKVTVYYTEKTGKAIAHFFE
jgi:hypothetical protein